PAARRAAPRGFQLDPRVSRLLQSRDHPSSSRRLDLAFKRMILGVVTLATLALAAPAFASFHLVQIEQAIGGVNGDTSRQAIQLRMRAAGQQFVQLGRLRAWDATGNNPVLLVDLTTQVANGNLGDRVLITTANFLPGLTPDFVMQPIPASYLAAGKITWEDDGGTV